MSQRLYTLAAFRSNRINYAEAFLELTASGLDSYQAVELLER